MSEAIKVIPEDFWRKESLKIDKSQIKDYFISDLVEKEIKNLNQDLDNKYKTALLDLKWDKLSDNDKNKMISSLKELVKDYNSKIDEAIKEYSYASSANEKEIKELLSSAWLTNDNIKLWTKNIRENWLRNISLYANWWWIEEKMKANWL